MMVSIATITLYFVHKISFEFAISQCYFWCKEMCRKDAYKNHTPLIQIKLTKVGKRGRSQNSVNKVKKNCEVKHL